MDPDISPVAEQAVIESTPATSPDVVPALSAEADAAPTETTAPGEVPAADAVLDSALDVDAEGDSESTPAAAETPEARLSRRQRAEAAMQARIDAAIEQKLAADAARAASEAALAQRRAADEQLAAAVANIIGNPNDENALIDAVASGDFEAADKLKALRANRAQAGQLYQYAQQKVYADLLEKIHATKSLAGVDAAVIDGVTDLSQVFNHVHEAATKAAEAKLVAKEAEWADRLERQKADYESRLGRAAAETMPTTETGGRAVGGRGLTRQGLAEMSVADYRKNKAWVDSQAAAGLIQ